MEQVIRKQDELQIDWSIFDGKIETEPSVSINFRGPQKYDHENQLFVFSLENNNGNTVISKKMTDLNYFYVKDKILSGKKYIADFYQMIDVSDRLALLFQRGKGSLCVGPQGISVLLSQKKNKNFPRGKYFVHFNNSEADERSVVFASVDPTGTYQTLTAIDSSKIKYDEKYFIVIIRLVS